MLYWEGYISEYALASFALYRLDHPGPIDLVEWAGQVRAKIEREDFAGYRVAIRMYEAAIDAAEGIARLIDFLNGRLVDVEA